MNKKNLIAIIVILLAGIALGWKILRTEKKHVSTEHHEHGGHGHEHGHEGHGDADHVTLTPAQLKNSGIVVEEAGSARIKTALKVYGKIGVNEDLIVHVRPRYSGVVKKIGKRLGEAVKKGDLLAVVESSESLQPYEIRAETDGTVVEKEITLGEVVNDQSKIYIVADLSMVWVNLNVYRQEFTKLKLGRKVVVNVGDGVGKIAGEISYISAFGSENTQTMLARAEISNAQRMLRPGLFVTAEIVLEETDV